MQRQTFPIPFLKTFRTKDEIPANPLNIDHAKTAECAPDMQTHAHIEQKTDSVNISFQRQRKYYKRQAELFNVNIITKQPEEETPEMR